jgi:hypothetical protein
MGQLQQGLTPGSGTCVAPASRLECKVQRPMGFLMPTR